MIGRFNFKHLINLKLFLNSKPNHFPNIFVKVLILETSHYRRGRAAQPTTPHVSEFQLFSDTVATYNRDFQVSHWEINSDLTSDFIHYILVIVIFVFHRPWIMHWVIWNILIVKAITPSILVRFSKFWCLSISAFQDLSFSFTEHPRGTCHVARNVS